MRNLFRVLSCVALLTSASLVNAAGVPGSPASVWDSTVVIDPIFGIYPVGGSGQVNGDFVIDSYVEPTMADTAIQTGLRVQERFFGPTFPTVGDTFFVTPGESVSGTGLGTWNLDIHLDFGTADLAGVHGLGLSPLDMRDFDVILDVDVDPSAGVSFTSFDLNLLATVGGIPPGSPILLSQASTNPGFGLLPGYNPFAPGDYFFSLTVTDPATSTVLASSDIHVIVVPEPSTLILGGLLFCFGAIFVRRSR